MDLHERERNFLAVIQSHKGIVYKIANAYCRDPEERKDLVQEILIQVWKSFEKYDPAFKHSTWIYRIALNVAISNYRKVKSRGIMGPLPKEILTIETRGDDGGTNEMIESLYTFISALKELDKALMLLYLEEKSQKEIAEILGLSETNVATKIGRVKKLLKEKFITQK
jgi:RNA polymerase sigma factor (sigma-70 family)